MRTTVHATACAAVLTGSDSNRGETGLTCDFAPFSGAANRAEGRAAGLIAILASQWPSRALSRACEPVRASAANTAALRRSAMPFRTIAIHLEAPWAHQGLAIGGWCWAGLWSGRPIKGDYWCRVLAGFAGSYVGGRWGCGRRCAWGSGAINCGDPNVRRPGKGRRWSTTAAGKPANKPRRGIASKPWGPS